MDTSGPDPQSLAGPTQLRLSEHPRVGIIAWIHPEGHTVLIQLDPHIATLPDGGQLVTRNAQFEPQAVLQIIGPAEDRLLAARVLGGTIARDQGVVAPGPELREWGEQSTRVQSAPASE